MTVQTLISSVDSRHKSQNVESSGYFCEEKRPGQEELLDKDDDELLEKGEESPTDRFTEYQEIEYGWGA